VQHYEVIVSRKLSNRFVVTARTGAEAAMAVGALLARDDPWEGSTEVEQARQMRSPSLTEAPHQQTLDEVASE